jgi:hypothetical protein
MPAGFAFYDQLILAEFIAEFIYMKFARHERRLFTTARPAVHPVASRCDCCMPILDNRRLSFQNSDSSVLQFIQAVLFYHLVEYIRLANDTSSRTDAG